MTATPPASLARRSCSFSRSKSEVAEAIWERIWATLSLTSPALFVITAVSKALDKFKNALLVEKIFYGLRPCSIALITAAGLGVAKISLLNIKNDIPAPNILSFFDWKCILLAVIMWYALWRFKKHPVIYIAISAAIGIFFEL